MHRTGKKTLDVLKRFRPDLQVQLQSLYTFANNQFQDKTNSVEAQDLTPNGQSKKQNIHVYSFGDLADIVYFELLQKFMSEYGYERFSQQIWREKFTVDDSYNATVWKAYNWLKNEFKLSNSDLIDVTFSVFEIASKYTAAANTSISNILSISASDDEKQKAIDEATINERLIESEKVSQINKLLFLPIEEKLRSTQSSDNTKKETGKMSQSDIDALFG